MLTKDLFLERAVVALNAIVSCIDNKPCPHCGAVIRGTDGHTQSCPFRTGLEVIVAGKSCFSCENQETIDPCRPEAGYTCKFHKGMKMQIFTLPCECWRGTGNNS